MSSKYVRDTIKTYMTTELSAEKIVDLTSRYKEWRDFLNDNSITMDNDWYGLQFGADPERPITIPATDTSGKYREEGFIFVHIVEPIIRETDTLRTNLENRGETIKNLFRGKRIGGIIIESVSQPNYESGVTLTFSGGYQASAIIITYQYDLDL